MGTREIVDVMAELIPEDGSALARRHGPQALVEAQAIRTELVPHLEGSPLAAQIWGQFQQAPGEIAPMLAGAIQVLLAADAALARRLDALLAAYHRATATAPATSIDTGGGAYVGGGVHTRGGPFVGRDQIVHGDQVYGDKVGGDKITGLGGDEIARLFAVVYRRIEARPEDPDVDKDEIAGTVQQIEREVSKGEDANPRKLERWIRHLALMSSDIFDVVVACLSSPVAGVTTVVRKVIDKAKGEAETAET